MLSKYRVLLPEAAREVHHYCVKVPQGTKEQKQATRHLIVARITELSLLVWGRIWAHVAGENTLSRKCRCVKVTRKL